MTVMLGRWLLSTDACLMKRTLLCTCTKAQPVRNTATGSEPRSQRTPPERTHDGQIFSKRLIADLKEKSASQESTHIPPSTRFVYPEFVPDPRFTIRHPIAEKLERKDMLARRGKVVIPEFYPGTIMAITTSNVHSPEKQTRFMGICLYKGGAGLNYRCILRNAINGEGFDVVYDVYSPLIQRFEIIRLEKRLDDNLLYLRDALIEYSTFPFDMIPERRPEGSQVPINPLQVVMKPRPWGDRWERHELKGVKDFGLSPKFFKRAAELAKPWEKYDLMKQYRATIPDEEQQEIFSEVYDILSKQEDDQEKERRRLLIQQKLQRKIKIG